VKVAKLAGKLADPASAEWGSVDPVQIPLAPVALEVQPTEYIREAWNSGATHLHPIQHIRVRPHGRLLLD